jgi:hypothetical protein
VECQTTKAHIYKQHFSLKKKEGGRMGLVTHSKKKTLFLGIFKRKKCKKKKIGKKIIKEKRKNRFLLLIFKK